MSTTETSSQNISLQQKAVDNFIFVKCKQKEPQWKPRIQPSSLHCLQSIKTSNLVANEIIYSLLKIILMVCIDPEYNAYWWPVLQSIFFFKKVQEQKIVRMFLSLASISATDSGPWSLDRGHILGIVICQARSPHYQCWPNLQTKELYKKTCLETWKNCASE